MTATTNNLPTFREWMQINHPEMLNEDWDYWKSVGKGVLGAGALAAALYGGSKMLPSGGSSAPAPTPKVQMVRNNDSSTNTSALTGVSKASVTPKDVIPSKSGVVDDTPPSDPTPKIGKTFRMKGGHSGYADVRATVSRPGKNVWVFDIKGEILPREAIKQAKAIVQDELGARTQSGISAEFNPTDDGMSVTIRYATPGQR